MKVILINSLFFLATLLLLLLVIVGTDFVSDQNKDNRKAEDAKDEDGKENHIALLPSSRQSCIFRSHIS